MWLSASSRYFSFIPDTRAPALGGLGGALNLGFRFEPVVLEAKAPNAEGREINLIRHTTDVTAGLRVGVGNRMELTLALPAGLYQRGAGIKGVTHQSSPPISEQSLHDPRVGFGYALPLQLFNSITYKLQLELKLPIGDESALMGERSFVTSPTLVVSARRGGFFSGGMLGFRLRRPSDFFGRRIGTQGLVALGLGYELAKPQLAFGLEAYVLPSLEPSSAPRNEMDVAAEWLASVRFTPRRVQVLSFGLSSGTGIPMPHGDSGWQSGVGVPLLRVLALARWAAP